MNFTMWDFSCSIPDTQKRKSSRELGPKEREKKKSNKKSAKSEETPKKYVKYVFIAVEQWWMTMHWTWSMLLDTSICCCYMLSSVFFFLVFSLQHWKHTFLGCVPQMIYLAIIQYARSHSRVSLFSRSPCLLCIRKMEKRRFGFCGNWNDRCRLRVRTDERQC